MELRVIGSSSRGNGYILDNGDEALIIEAGVKFTDIKKALGFNIRKVAGCLVTHEHNDHAEQVGSIVKAGIYTLALPEVFAAKGCAGEQAAIEVEPGKGYRLGNFKVMPFAGWHDVPCVGYIIHHPAMGKMLFLTDSGSCAYRFSGLNHVLIECNYTDDALQRAIEEGRTLIFQKNRLMTTHMGLETCKRFLSNTDLAKVREIVLLHGSENNGDEAAFLSEISGQTGKPVYIAKPGLTLDLM